MPGLSLMIATHCKHGHDLTLPNAVYHIGPRS